MTAPTNRKQETKGKGHDMNTEYYNNDTYDIETAEFEHYDGTRHALLVAMIREAENRTYRAEQRETTPEEKAAARAVWHTLNYLTQVIDDLEFTTNEDTRRAAEYEEATAAEHNASYNTIYRDGHEQEEQDSRERLTAAQRAAAERVMRETKPYNVDVLETAGRYYRFTYTEEPPYTRPLD